MPHVSVIIPTYNRARYVTAAIDSVLAQTFTDYEIIVVDDGSTDNTKEVLQSYKDKIHYIYQPNKGVSAARNTGIKAAKGEWIAFLDSDDEWLPEKLEMQMCDLRQYPGAVLSSTNVRFESPNTNLLDHFKDCLCYSIAEPTYIAIPGNINFTTSYLFTSTVVADRRSIVEVGMFCEHLTLFEDLDLWLRLSTKGGFVINPLLLVKANRHSESETLNLSGQFLRDKKKNHDTLIQIYQELLQLELTKEQKSYAKHQLSSAWFDLGFYYHKNGQKKQAYCSFLKCFMANPSMKNFLKMTLGLIGPSGLGLIERRRQTHKGFRRSEYYQNGNV